MGSVSGVLFSLLAYLLYTTAYQVPGPVFEAPQASVWLSMAYLVSGGSSLPSHVIPVCMVVFFASALLQLLALCQPKLACYLPSGMAMAIGVYVTPHWTVPRVAGAVGQAVWQKLSLQTHQAYMVPAASGMVLGEGVTSIFVALFSILLLGHS